MTEKKTVKFMWNDQEIEANEGENLLQAALDNGIDVAHYCYHQGLPIAGVCRMCVVEQTPGPPQPFPACNATVAPGIVVRSDTEEVKEAVKWTLQYHLVNHPLDCPVCDQSGECGLQEYYMDHGQYDSSMVDNKVHKDKVQDIGCNVMLDAERCILCTRCTRFTEFITETHELGIVNRGDHSEIIVHKKLENDYAGNLVDICPVGALTSKDFRFKQRVWYLDEVETTCIGCETGCAIKVSQNENGVYRVLPKYDEKVNGHWICDDGRDTYKHVSGTGRLIGPLENKTNLFIPTTEEKVSNALAGKNQKYILSAGLTNEEYLAFFDNYAGKKDFVALYSLPHQGKDFDGILKRSDKNANSKGAEAAFFSSGFDPSENTLHELIRNIEEDDVVYVVIPEVIYDEDHFITLIKQVEKAGKTVALTSSDNLHALDVFDYLLPIPTFLEKEGHVTNFQGTERKLNKGRSYGAVNRDVAFYASWLN